jgi:exonuclease SbcD
MAHAFVSGGVGSDSERDISVGGVSAVSPEVFDGASYVALGHLHGQQQVEANVRYSGSPVAMSFGEAGQRKGSLLLDVTTGGVTAELLEAPVPRPLAVLRGDPEHAWCQITLTDGIRPQGAMDRLRRRFPHTLELRFEPQGVAIPTRSYTERVHARSDVDVCCDFLEHVRGGASATDDERELFQQALEESRVHRQELDDRGRTAAGLAGRAAGAA